MEIPDQALGFKGNPGFPGHDRNGFRNPAVPASADIVVLGDSQSYGVNAEADDSWPRILERKLGTRVYNMSFGSYSAVTHLMLFEQALAFRPKLIIEAIYSGNDLGEAYLFVYPQNKFLQLRSSDPSVLESIASAERSEPFAEKIAVLFSQRSFEEKQIKPFTRFFLRHSKLYLLLRAGKWKIEDMFCEKVSPWDAEKQRARNAPHSFQIFEEGAVRTIFCAPARLAVLKNDDPRVREGMRLCCESIRRMNLRCKERGITFLVVGIPTKEYVFKDRALNSLRSAQPYAELIKNEECAWADVAAFLSGEGIPFIDCLAGLRSAIRDASQPYSQNANGHPNATGYTAIASDVMDHIRQ
jgi:lysophospholipase L1-like esterase